ncbi:unnamed protein product [Euphydryas editha]|uniref:Uncharacterized protein n=1 Tax=Euphydryas editha TaxID=104508 RepID=A0AAU9UAU5_EUPED|nr:unnamed protein product [Euphydryas editha]
MQAKSRHISLDVTNSMFGNNLALSVLRDSYKGIDTESGKVTPQIKKLKKNYSKIFEDHKDFTKSSAEHLERAVIEVDMSELKPRVPMYRSVSLEMKENETNENDLDGKKLRQRRFGVTTNVWQENPIRNLRKEVLIRQNSSRFKSCDEIFVKSRLRSRPGSVEAIDDFIPFADVESFKKTKYSGEYLSNKNLKRNVSFDIGSEIKEHNLPSLVNTKRYTEDDVINDINNKEIDSSNLVEVDRNCDCRICSKEVDDHRKSFLSRNLHKIFMRIMSYKEFGRSLVCWDENNNVNENQMYACVIHVLKLLLGLWLRHFDHKQPNICC